MNIQIADYIPQILNKPFPFNLNRFNLPAKKIIKRYRNNAVKVFNTADSGALEITLDVQGRLTIKQWRLDNRNLWRRH